MRFGRGLARTLESSWPARTAPPSQSERSLALKSERFGASAMSEYVVIFERAEDGGWGAYLPDLPGVVALGDTREQVAAGIQEALVAYAEELRSLGKQLPAPAATASTVQAA
jgi:predicted RNase H-like HicB family nuclease